MINWESGPDQSECCAIFLVDSTEQGSTRVQIAGAGDKRQITVALAGTLSGKLLPFQILYEGKAK